jgi:hypothetical protein
MTGGDHLPSRHGRLRMLRNTSNDDSVIYRLKQQVHDNELIWQ